LQRIEKSEREGKDKNQMRYGKIAATFLGIAVGTFVLQVILRPG